MLGIGIGLRHEMASDIIKNRDCIDWLEFYPDSFIHQEADITLLEEVKEMFPLCPHCLNFSIGSKERINKEYLNSIKKMVNAYNSPWFSDHLCFTQVNGVDVGHLAPIERSEESLEIVTRNIKTIKKEIKKEFLIENITFDFELPTNQYNEMEFINKVLENADCGLLLDVTNVFINSENHKFDPYKYIDEINLERVIEIHIAGGIKDSQGYWIDSHSERINKEVWNLLEYTLRKSSTKGILLELDANYPKHFEVVREELQIAKSLFNKYNCAVK